jgi:phage tail-like protein
MEFATAHALLRDRRHWHGVTTGLGVDIDGSLRLARVPAPADRRVIEIPTQLPYERQVSGIATGPCEAVFVADTAHDRVLYLDGRCGATTFIPGGDLGTPGAPGEFHAPRGLAVAADRLLVADSENARVQHLAFPGLEPHLATGGVSPTSLAVDRRGRILVIDEGTRLRRFDSSGIADPAFDAAIAAEGRLKRPLFVVCDDDDRMLVSDGEVNAVFVFDKRGSYRATLAGPQGWMPGALAIAGRRTYVADAATGGILIFDGDRLLCRLATWSGPVTAMGTAADGALLVKPGLDAVFFSFAPDAAYVAGGAIEAGPFDAGEDRDWVRICVDAEVPAGTTVTVQAAVTASATATPAASDWRAIPCFDALVAPDVAPRRFVWMRVDLATTVPLQSPRVTQVRLATAEEDLREYLPQVFTRVDGENGFLSRWLQLIRGEFGRVEEWIDDMPRMADPQFAPPDSLPWLAGWFGLDLPQIADDTERRQLLARVPAMFARRGTPASIAEFVELHTGIRPAIVEGFADRRLWILGVTSQLGFDTRLPPLDPMGIVLPDDATSPCCGEESTPALRCLPCATADRGALSTAVQSGPVGRVVMGESGPLAEHQIGLPLFAEDAYRFCVLVDGYRAADRAVRREIARIVDREKPAHTDYRIEYIAPEARVGLQAQIGIDLIVGGDPPPLTLGAAALGAAWLPPSDVARVGETRLDGTLTLG